MQFLISVNPLILLFLAFAIAFVRMKFALKNIEGSSAKKHNSTREQLRWKH